MSLADPLQIVELKGLIAGPVNLTLGLVSGGSLPPLSPLVLAGIVGFVGYGVSLTLFVMALRHLGTARTGAYFSTAPFLGTVVAILFLHEPVTVQLFVAGLLMAIGVWLHVTEIHQHDHDHLLMDHAHRHEPLRHTHPHVPDMHHLHRH